MLDKNTLTEAFKEIVKKKYPSEAISLSESEHFMAVHAYAMYRFLEVPNEAVATAMEIAFHAGREYEILTRKNAN